jgi:phasin family protein
MLRCSKNVEPVMTATTKDRKMPRTPAKASPVQVVPVTAAPSIEPEAPERVVKSVAKVVAKAPAKVTAKAPAETMPKPVPAPVASRRAPPVLTPLPTSPQYKEKTMATAFETTKDTVAETVKATVTQFNESAEAAMTNGKAAMEQVTAQAKDAVESSMKSLDEMTEVARGNVEALLASARVAAAGFETLAAHLSEVSRKSFEATTTTARAMTSAKTPNELFQMQSDFAKAQFDSAVSEFSKLTEMMVKMSGEVMEPVQNRVAITTDKMKAAFNK